jgi:hypothetical protein
MEALLFSKQVAVAMTVAALPPLVATPRNVLMEGLKAHNVTLQSRRVDHPRYEAVGNLLSLVKTGSLY